MDLQQLRESMRVGPALIGALVVLALILGSFAITSHLEHHSPTPTTGDQLPPGLTTDSSGGIVPGTQSTTTTDLLATTAPGDVGTTAPATDTTLETETTLSADTTVSEP